MRPAKAACGPPAGEVEHHPEQADAVVQGLTEEAACGPPVGEVEHHPVKVDAVVLCQAEGAAPGPLAGEENGQMAQLLVEQTAADAVAEVLGHGHWQACKVAVSFPHMPHQMQI